MATWTTIPDASLEPGKPIRSIDGLALRDNPVAIAEAATGAPRISLAAIVDALASVPAGSVGSYVFAYSTAGDVSFGSTVAGSTLRPTSAARGVSLSGISSLSYSVAFNVGGGLSGTWRCMSTFDASATSSGAGELGIQGAGLWLRIA